LLTTFIAVLFTNERFAGISRLLFELQLVLVYALAMNIVRRDNDARKLTSIMLFTLAVQSVICIIQWRLGTAFSLLGDTDDLGDIPRPGGTVSTNPAGFCSFILPALMIAAARFMNRDRRERHPFDWLLVLLGVTAIILTFTRAAWVGLALGLAYITVVGIRWGYITARQMIVVAAAVVAVSIPAIPLMQARLNAAPVGDSYDERANLKQIAVNVILHHPVFGIGPGAYDHEFKQYLPPGSDRFWLAGVHNEYLMRTAETGIAGGVAFVWVLLSALSQARRLSRSSDTRTRIFGLGWSAGLLALAWQMYWVPWRGFSYNSILWLFMGAAEALIVIDERRKAAELPAPDSSVIAPVIGNAEANVATA
jgi:O-antigen ligase